MEDNWKSLKSFEQGTNRAESSVLEASSYSSRMKMGMKKKKSPRAGNLDGSPAVKVKWA